MKAGADLNAQNQELETPLHQATDANHFHMAEVLVKAGADLNIQVGDV